MFSIVSRNNPATHPILSNLYECIPAYNNKKFDTITVKKFGLTFYLSDNKYKNAKYVFIDDPLAFLYAILILKISRKKIIFYSLEMYEYQVKNHSLKNFLRNQLFNITHKLSLKLANKVIFPSILRSKFYSRSRKNYDILYNYPTEKALQISAPVPELLQLITQIKNKEKLIAIYAGSFQDGRNVSDFIQIAKKNSSIEFILVGSYQQPLPSLPDNIYFIGRLPRPVVNYFYSIANIGILFYDNAPLNTKFCAPVKIWEYKYFNLQIVANDNFALLNEWNEYINTSLDKNKSIKLTIHQEEQKKEDLYYEQQLESYINKVLIEK